MTADPQQLLIHLPYLRRYARALSGSTARGDALVRRALEIARADPRSSGDGEGERSALYGLLNQLQDGEQSGTPVSTQVDGLGHPIEVAVQRLDETERRLFLLIGLEGLSVVAAARVMGISVDSASAGMARARTAMREQLTADILVVEDDAIIAEDLAETVRAMGHSVCGTAATRSEALDIARRDQPTLALMDVRLADGSSGVTTAQDLRAMMALPIIFVTAYADELRASSALALGPVIAKPFTREEIERAITQAVFTPHDGDFRDG
jgi:CheY-like chemotaxis protein/DNA-directed RNA polymerase specialized sigma24 family protein